MSIEQSIIGWDGVRVSGGSVEPLVSSAALVEALAGESVEHFRPLLPVGYEAGVAAYRSAVHSLDVNALTRHYTDGLAFFHNAFVPHLKRRLSALAGDAWNLDDFVAYAAGSDVDFMTHVVEAAAGRGPVTLFPGDWYGFMVGATRTDAIRFTLDSGGSLACVCIPSVKNGHVTEEMVSFLARADACLLNINLFPTLAPKERIAVAQALTRVPGLLDRSIISVSFSRGFGLTASQLGVALLHKNHPYRALFDTQWSWLTYFYNAIAARAFMAMDMERLEAVDEERRAWVHAWLRERGLPVVQTGTYYVKSFRLSDPQAMPAELAPLARGEVVRLCFKPPLH